MNWVALIPALPAAAFVILLPLSRNVRNKLLFVPVAAMISSATLSIVALLRMWPSAVETAHAAEQAAEKTGEAAVAAVWSLGWSFGVVGDSVLRAGLALDPIAAATLVTVTIVAACVQVYSLGYMHRDERVGWYFAVLSLFTAAMLALVLSTDLLFTFAMWEMMGLCSYLLIGFWYQQEAPRKASQKAFLTTRIGDIGFLVALFTIFANTGEFGLQNAIETAGEWAPGAVVIVSLGLLWAAMGKSAQMPLHVWLPDAMAGPTPASALIHAATMVAAGVFVVARTLPIFEHAPAVMTAMMVIGAITAFAGGLLAAVQHDIKKVAAYSTISQLGLMFVALGAGSAVAAMFHLTTHAFFKSLIFLGAGVIIHAAHTQDMREMGGLAKHMPVTTATFTIGSLALAGLPPLAGFFSKDEILVVLLHEHHYVTFGVVILSSALTAYYMTRLWFRVFAGAPHSHELHEAHKTMLAPMSLLAAITVVVGFATVQYSGFLGHEGHFPSIGWWALSFAVAGAGMAAGWWVYGRATKVDTAVWKSRLGYLYGALSQKLYFDLTFDFAFVRGFFTLSQALAVFDMKVVDGVVNGASRLYVRSTGAAWKFDGFFIDGAVNGLGKIARRTGSALRGIQTGQLQFYQRLVIGAVVLLMLYFVVVGKGA